MTDNNVLKFERRKPQHDKGNKPEVPGPKKGLIWIVVVIVIAVVWAYYQFIAPPSL